MEAEMQQALRRCNSQRASLGRLSVASADWLMIMIIKTSVAVCYFVELCLHPHITCNGAVG